MKVVEFARSAEIVWEGDVARGSGVVRGSTSSFGVPVSFPSLRGEPAGTTSPEELLAASHAACFGIGLRSVIARRGGVASRIVVNAKITARKGGGGIRIVESSLSGVVYGLAGIDPGALSECGVVAKDECTISNALKGNVEIVCAVTSATEQETSAREC